MKKRVPTSARRRRLYYCGEVVVEATMDDDFYKMKKGRKGFIHEDDRSKVSSFPTNDIRVVWEGKIGGRFVSSSKLKLSDQEDLNVSQND